MSSWVQDKFPWSSPTMFSWVHNIPLSTPIMSSWAHNNFPLSTPIISSWAHNNFPRSIQNTFPLSTPIMSSWVYNFPLSTPMIFYWHHTKSHGSMQGAFNLYHTEKWVNKEIQNFCGIFEVMPHSFHFHQKSESQHLSCWGCANVAMAWHSAVSAWLHWLGNHIG